MAFIYLGDVFSNEGGPVITIAPGWQAATGPNGGSEEWWGGVCGVLQHVVVSEPLWEVFGPCPALLQCQTSNTASSQLCRIDSRVTQCFQKMHMSHVRRRGSPAVCWLWYQLVCELFFSTYAFSVHWLLPALVYHTSGQIHTSMYTCVFSATSSVVKLREPGQVRAYCSIMRLPRP